MTTGISGRFLSLQEVLLKAGRDRDSPAHVVGMVRQPETVEVANFLIDKMGHGVLTAELLQPDELVSGIIAQARPFHVVHRQISCLLSALPRCEGLPEPYLDGPASGVDPETSMGNMAASLHVCASPSWKLI